MKIKKRTFSLALAGALTLGLLPAFSSPALAADGDTSYTLTIPATLTVANSGWNATGGISASGTLESGKVLTVTASSTNSWALKDGENSVSYNLATDSGTYSSTANPAYWEFNSLSNTPETKPMGIIVEDYSTKPAGTYQDIVTFTATVDYPPVTIPTLAFRRRVFEDDVFDDDDAWEAARSFRQGETVAVTAEGQDTAIYECANANSQTWTLKQGLPLRWTQGEMYFGAYCPATTGTSMTSFTMPTDQSTPEKLAAANYMTRKQMFNNEYSTDIDLALEPKMAKVKVHVKGFSSALTDDQKYISDGSMRIYSEYERIEDGNPSGDSTEVKPYIQKANSADNGYKVGSTFTAHVTPSYGDDGARFLQFSNYEGSTLMVKGIPELQEGYAYEYDLGVGKHGAVLMDHQNNPTPIQSITLADQTVTIGGDAFILMPTISPSNATCKALEWFIPDAAVNSLTYLETANSYMINDRAAMCASHIAQPGTYKVYAYALDGSGAVGECNVTVLPKYVTSFNLNKTATTIQAGNKETLSVSGFAPNNATYKTVTWSSDNTDVATVNATTGEVTAVAKGTANITATATDGSGVTATCAVTVTPAPAPITVTWNNDDITGSGNSFTKDDVTITAGSIDFDEKNFEENGTFTTTLGNFTKIEVVVTNGFCDVSGTGWSGDSEKRTWTGNASSVSFIGDIYGDGNGIKFVFTIVPTN